MPILPKKLILSGEGKIYHDAPLAINVTLLWSEFAGTNSS
jgi:hypothetical protein